MSQSSVRSSEHVEADIPHHWAEEMPYRTLVYIRHDRDTPLFAVAGVQGGPWKGERALRRASEVHPARCFYCHTEKTKNQQALTIDHIDPAFAGRRGDIANLVLACVGCNRKKANRPVEEFDPKAGRSWLAAILRETRRG
jgi:5-methylcytosine-specific restriction endonuclease McrA